VTLPADPSQFLSSGVSRNGRLRFAHINIRSLVPQAAALVRDVIAFYRLDVLAVGETWLRNSIDPSTLMNYS